MVLEELCYYRDIFNRAEHLLKNWKTGIYFIPPVIKLHKGQVSAFDSNGKQWHNYDHFMKYKYRLENILIGKIVVSGCSDDKFVKIWSINELECTCTIKFKNDSINCLKIYVILTLIFVDNRWFRYYKAIFFYSFT